MENIIIRKKTIAIFAICMADIKTPEQRSLNMAAIRGKNTKPEMIVRKYLFSRGMRFRIQVRKLPGTPDIVLPRYRTVIFVDGCFWHGHEGCRYYRLPKSNVEFWREKIERNIARDARDECELKALGWNVVRVWECDIRRVAEREVYLQCLYDIITRPPSAGNYETEYEAIPMAAEPGPDTDYGSDNDR